MSENQSENSNQRAYDKRFAAMAAPSRKESAKSNVSRYVSFGVLLGVIAIVGVLFYEVMAKFLVPLFLSALLVVVFRPTHQWILGKVGGRQQVAAGLTTAIVLLAVLVPIGVLLMFAAAEGREAYKQFNSSQIVEGVRQIRTNLDFDMPSQQSLRLIESEIIDLQAEYPMDGSEESRHQIALFEIEDAAKQLSVELKLDYPTDEQLDSVAEEDGWKPTSDWEEFLASLKISQNLHGQMSWETGGSVEEKRARHDALHDYRANLNQTSKLYSKFKNELLGGKTRAWITELVNPTNNDAESYVNSAVDFMKTQLLVIGGKGASFVGSLLLGTAIMIIGLYFFLLDGPRMIESFKGLSPIDDDHEQELVTEFGKVSRAVVVATLLSALVQGLLAGIGFYFAGLESIFLLTVLSAVLAMVPFVGAAAVWIPCSLYLYFIDNNLTAAIGLAIFGVAVISMADNVIKPFILHGQSNLHPLLALLSVIGGVGVLGPIGILIGPMVVAFLQTLLKILRREIGEIDGLDEPASV